MSKTLNLSNAHVAAPSIAMVAVGLNAVNIVATDGLGGSINLTVPRTQAKTIANSLNGTVNAQVREELENGERAGTLTEAQAKRLQKIRDTAARTAELNAQRSADAAARREAKAPQSGRRLKAVA